MIQALTLRKKIIIATVVLLAVMVLVVAFNIFKRYDKNIVIILNEEYINDGYYNELTLDGLKEACDDFEFNLIVYKVKNSNEFDVAISEALLEEPKLIVISDPAFEEETVYAAETYSDQNFILIDADADLNLDNEQDVANIYSIQFARNESGFISGIASTDLAKSSILFIGANEFPKYIEYESGFRFGVKTISQDISVAVKYYNEQDSDDNIIRDKLLSLFNKKEYDLIYTINKSTAIIDVASEMQIPVIIADYDYSKDLDTEKKGTIVAAAVNRIDKAVYLAVEDYVNGLFFGQIKFFGISDDCIEFHILNEDVFTVNSIDFIQSWIDEFDNTALTIPKLRSEVQTYQLPTLTVITDNKDPE